EPEPEPESFAPVPAAEAASPPLEAPTAPAAPAPAEVAPSAAAVEEIRADTKPFEAGKDQRKIKDDVDRDLLPIFLEEAREIVPAVSEAVRRWKAAPADHSFAGDLHRHLHTLKGSARMSGLMR